MYVNLIVVMQIKLIMTSIENALTNMISSIQRGDERERVVYIYTGNTSVVIYPRRAHPLIDSLIYASEYGLACGITPCVFFVTFLQSYSQFLKFVGFEAPQVVPEHIIKNITTPDPSFTFATPHDEGWVRHVFPHVVHVVEETFPMTNGQRNMLRMSHSAGCGMDIISHLASCAAVADVESPIYMRHGETYGHLLVPTCRVLIYNVEGWNILLDRVSAIRDECTNNDIREWVTRIVENLKGLIECIKHPERDFGPIVSFRVEPDGGELKIGGYIADLFPLGCIGGNNPRITWKSEYRTVRSLPSVGIRRICFEWEVRADDADDDNEDNFIVSCRLYSGMIGVCKCDGALMPYFGYAVTELRGDYVE